jgi:oligosaccharide repeat unit polymerase
MPLLLIISCILLYFKIKKNNSIGIYLIFLQFVSMIGAILINKDYPIDTISKAVNLIYTIVILSIIIYPWTKVNKFNTVIVCDEVKVDRVTYVLIALLIMPFIQSLISAIYAYDYVDNIIEFRADQHYLDAFNATRPGNQKLFSISYLVVPLGGFMVPLHLYYLGKRRFILSIICLVLSLTAILTGLSAYSRSSVVGYVLSYLAMLYLLRKFIGVSLMSVIKKYIIILFGAIVFYFNMISLLRFNDYREYSSDLFGDYPVLFAYIDYMSMWYSNSMTLLDGYKFITFNGGASLFDVINKLNGISFLNLHIDTDSYINLRNKLWPVNYWTFNGFVCDSVFDYGYLFAVIFSLLYFAVVMRITKKINSIRIENLLLIYILIQVPVFSIYYSVVPGLVYSVCLFLPIYLYLIIGSSHKCAIDKHARREVL